VTQTDPTATQAPRRAERARWHRAWTIAAITLGALVAAEQVRPPTMTHLVRALERMGLVTRVADPDDGRIARIAATRRGKALLDAGRARRVRILSRRLRTLPKRDLATLARAAELLDVLSHD